MNPSRLFCLFCFFCLFSPLAFTQTPGQNVIDRKNSGPGFTRESVTISNGQLLGRTSNGTLSGLTLGSGLTLTGTTLTVAGSSGVAWADIVGKPAAFAPAAHTQAWSTITSTPTTLAGYGITDGLTIAAAAAAYAPLSHTQAWSTITARPTTLAGYGITDGLTTSAAAAAYAPLSHTQAWSTITARPTTLTGYGIADGLTTSAAAAAYATISSLNAKAPIASPVFTGGITTPAVVVASSGGDTIAPGVPGFGRADGRTTWQGAEGALQMFATGSPIEPVLYWPGRLHVASLEVADLVTEISGALVTSGTLPAGVMEDSMPQPFRQWVDRANGAGTAGIAYATTGPNSSVEPTTPGVYPMAIEVVDGGVNANYLKGVIRTPAQARTDLGISNTVTTETVTSNRTLTITINGVAYKILLRQ